MMPESKRWVFWLEREAMNYFFLLDIMYYCSVILLKGLEEFKISIICSLNVVLLFIIHENIFRGGLKSEQMYVLKLC